MQLKNYEGSNDKRKYKLETTIKINQSTNSTYII